MTGITDVNVIITKETAAVTQAGFGLPLIVGTAGLTGYDALGYQECENLAQVGALDEGVTDTAVYKMAAAIFSQTPAPPKIAVVWLDMDTGDSVATGMNELLANGHNDWYFLLTDSEDAGIIDAMATFASANKKLFFGNVPLTATTGADLSKLGETTKANERAVIVCHEEAFTQYPAAAWVGKCAPQLPGSITWKFKTLSGVGVSGYNPTQTTAIKDAHANLVVSQGGILHTAEGTVMSGEFIDVIRSQDFVSARIAENVFRLMATSPKVPYDDRGITTILAEVQAVMQQAVGMGIIARDTDGNGIWSVSAPARAEIPANDIANRSLPDVRFEFTLAGAIHSVTVSGIISL